MRLIQLSAVAALFAPADAAVGKRLNNLNIVESTRHLQDDECQSIVDIAVGSDPEFSTLVAALGAADLVGALSGDGPFTVFAPTNAAFAALDEGVVDSLLLPENKEALAGILTYHVVAAKVLSTDLANGDVETLNGASVTVNLDDGVKINDSNVVTADIDACNGVIHVIDAVLLPPDETEEAPAEADSAEEAPAESEEPAEEAPAPAGAEDEGDSEPPMMAGKSSKGSKSSKSAKAKTLKEKPMPKTQKAPVMDAKAEKISKSSKAKSSKASGKSGKSAKDTKAEKVTRHLRGL